LLGAIDLMDLRAQSAVTTTSGAREKHPQGRTTSEAGTLQLQIVDGGLRAVLEARGTSAARKSAPWPRDRVELIAWLQSQGVVHGIKEDVLDQVLQSLKRGGD